MQYEPRTPRKRPCANAVRTGVQSVSGSRWAAAMPVNGEQTPRRSAVVPRIDQQAEASPNAEVARWSAADGAGEQRGRESRQGSSGKRAVFSRCAALCRLGELAARAE